MYFTSIVPNLAQTILAILNYDSNSKFTSHQLLILVKRDAPNVGAGRVFDALDYLKDRGHILCDEGESIHSLVNITITQAGKVEACRSH
jgi:hypothetical protein